MYRRAGKVVGLAKFLDQISMLKSTPFHCTFQDGATAHTTDMVLDYLKDEWQTRIISRNADINGRGGVNWPSRSPDLNPLDFWYELPPFYLTNCQLTYML